IPMSHPTGPRFESRSYDFTPYVPCLNWIGGEWTAAKSGATLAVDNPRHGEVIGHVAMSDATDVDAAVAAAHAAFPAWRATPMRERAQVLYRFKALMEEHLEELAWLLSHENGKNFAEAKASVEKGIEC